MEHNDDLSYIPNTIEHPQQPEGGRDLSMYERQLLFDRHELEGKKVLDLGAGPHLKFAVELVESGIDADVVSLSPDFSNQEHAQFAHGIHPEGKIVAGVGQALPFQNETFDRIFAFHVDEHLSKEMFFDVIREMGHVLKQGGQAKLGPTLNIPGEWDPYQAILNNELIMEELNECHVKVSKEPIPEEMIPETKIKDSFGNAFYELSYNIVLNKDVSL